MTSKRLPGSFALPEVPSETAGGLRPLISRQDGEKFYRATRAMGPGPARGSLSIRKGQATNPLGRVAERRIGSVAQPAGGCSAGYVKWRLAWIELKSPSWLPS